MKFKFLSLIALYLYTGFYLNAQEILLNNYRYSSTLLNPAMVGNSESLNINTYFQGSDSKHVNSPFVYQTYGLNIDAPVLSLNKYKISAGYRYSKNISGSLFESNGHLISASISRKIERNKINHYIAIGIDGGVNIMKINEKGLRWPSQITPNGIDTSATGEMIYDVINKDFNVGAQYSIILKNGSKMTLGYGIFHFNRPNISFLNSNVKENIRTNLYLIGNYRISTKFELLPTVVYAKHGQFDAYNVSLGSKYYIKPTSWICLDLGYLKYEQPFVGFSAGFNKITFFGNYGFENNASLTKIETGLMYVFGKKSKS